MEIWKRFGGNCIEIWWTCYRNLVEIIWTFSWKLHRNQMEMWQKSNGNYVEIKNSFVGSNTSISHLSYIGDTEIGKEVNVGAGTITCNYDGVNKHKTVIKDNVFIGSDSQLVAPITIEEGVTIAAGSTITEGNYKDSLIIGRARQVVKKDWKRPK